MDHSGELFLGLMVAIALLSVVARWIGVPYPVLLVLGGLGLGFVPGLPDVQLDPDLVLVLFLPPLLYGAAFFSSLRDLRAALRPISLLAIGLVVLTTCAVAVVAHALVGGMPWAAAFALGAIVAPTDPLAVTAIARRLGVPRSIVTILEGESLINDGTALTLYAVAVAAAVGGTFSAWDAGGQFLLDTTGGVAIGLAVGLAVSAIRKPLDDPPVEVVISIATGYAAYLPAEQLGLSGVLAAVSAGIYLAWSAPLIASPRTRMQGHAVWEVLMFLLNAILFVLIGLQLPVILDGLESDGLWTLVGYSGAICATLVASRMLWMYTVPYLVRVLDPRLRQGEGRSTWQSRLIIGWSGIRGAVSMAAALALPLDFPRRDVILVVAFAVILFTLVVQGLTLPALIRAVQLDDDGEEEREEVQARHAAAEAALGRLEELEGEDWARDETIERVRAVYEYRRRRFQARTDDVDGSRHIEERSAAYQRLQRELLEAQRHALLRLRSHRDISDDVMRRVQHDIDLEDQRLEI